MKTRRRQNAFVRAIKKFLLSAFVVVSFTAYALENRATAGGAAPAPSGATGLDGGNAPGAAAGAPAGVPAAAATAAPADSAPAAGPPAPAAAPAATATTAPALMARSGYKDGTYTGPTVDVNWGYVQVQATIRNGKIANVQFLQYPSDRRTSQRINYYAVPVLQQEAVQAQSANVNLITGATLTSEGFQMSLQNALSQAGS